MQRAADLIVTTALELGRTRPDLHALEALDAAMRGQHGTSPSFECTGQPWDDWTDAASPFGQLLARAFGPAPDEQTLLDRFAARYALWGG